MKSEEQLDYDLKYVTLINLSLDNSLKREEIELKRIEQSNLQRQPTHEMIRTIATIFGAGAALIFTLVRIF